MKPRTLKITNPEKKLVPQFANEIMRASLQGKNKQTLKKIELHLFVSSITLTTQKEREKE